MMTQSGDSPESVLELNPNVKALIHGDFGVGEYLPERTATPVSDFPQPQFPLCRERGDQSERL